MLRGSSIVLRPVREADLDELYAFHTDIDNRGEYFPRGVLSSTAFRQQFQQDGLWGKDEGMLVIVSFEDRILGHVEFFRTVPYLDEIELSYQIYAPEDRGKGFATQSVDLLVRYLFETRQVNRIRLVIHPDNAPSRRLAATCRFQHEGTARGAWYNNGTHQDVEIYAILHDEVIPGVGRRPGDR